MCQVKKSLSFREGLIKKNKSGYFPDGGGGGPTPFPIFFLRTEILKNIYNGIIHAEN